jgi:AAA15 family ATPase/GTPase
MIVEFSVKNFRSIKELQTISFAATGLKSSLDNLNIDINNIVVENDSRILKTIGIYGSNASGKSNIIKALDYFLRVISSEASSDSNLSTLCDPFLFQDNSNDTESFFQIVLTIVNKKYRYGFTVKKNSKVIKINPEEKFSQEIITSEWLFGTKEKNMVEFFTRTGLEVNKDKFPNNEKIPPLPYEHTLFLTHSAAFDNSSDSSIIKSYLSSWIFSNISKGFDLFRFSSLYFLEKLDKKNDFLKMLSSFGLSYSDIEIERDSSTQNTLNLPLDKIYFTKSFVGKNNNTINIKLNLNNNESSGTQKLFDFAGALCFVFNMNLSAFFIIDEIDSNFHPSLLIKLIEIFNDKTINKNNSQLLFTSHDTNLMAPSIMRRDQFYLTEKNEEDSTRLYSLADLKGIKNDADFAKQYLAGFYGALPILNNYSN